MKDFIIYLQPREQEKILEEKKYCLDELENFPGTSNLEELDLVRDGSLRILQDIEPHRVFQFSCKFPIRVVAAKKPVYAELTFDLWQRKHGPIVASFEGRRKASRVAVALLSFVTYGDPYAINPIRLTVSDFRNLMENILEKHSGTMSQIYLRNIRSKKGKVRRFLMTGSGLEEFLDLDELLQSASDISGMGFVIPSFGGERKLSFRIKDWGGGQIYSPANPYDHEISRLLQLLEQVLFGDVRT